MVFVSFAVGGNADCSEELLTRSRLIPLPNELTISFNFLIINYYLYIKEKE